MRTLPMLMLCFVACLMGRLRTCAKEANLYTEIAEGIHSYGVTRHRHERRICDCAKEEWNFSYSTCLRILLLLGECISGSDPRKSNNYYCYPADQAAKTKSQLIYVRLIADPEHSFRCG